MLLAADGSDGSDADDDDGNGRPATARLRRRNMSPA